MKKNENLEVMKQVLNQPPHKNRTMRESLREILYQMAQNEEVMKDTLEKSPQLYDLTMKVYLEEKERREQK